MKAADRFVYGASSLAARLEISPLVIGAVVLGFGTSAPDGALNLSAAGDIIEAAANLFAYLRRLDAPGTQTIAVMPIPESGLGRAINDRLRRAANRQ